MEKSFSGCEIAELGIEIEKNGRDFYQVLAGNASDGKLKDTLMTLSRAEDRHITTFQKIFEDASCDHSSEGSYPEEYFSYINALASQYVFTQKDKGAEIAKGIKTSEEGLEMAIGFEKDSILFFEEMKKLVPEKSRSLVDALIQEEKKHLWDLTTLLDY